MGFPLESESVVIFAQPQIFIHQMVKFADTLYA